MYKNRNLRGMVLAVVCGGLLTAPSPWATASQPIATISDVSLGKGSLGKGGTLEGVVVDAQGAPIVGTVVELRQSDRVVGRTTTDTLGRFKLRHVSGGVYQVSAGGGYGIFRLWQAGTSPPTANNGVLIVGGSDPLRGQFTPGAMFSSNGLILGGLVAATIAIPVAVTSSRLGS